MPDLRNHGGGCCGMRHVFGFYDCDTAAARGRALDSLDEHIRLLALQHNGNRLIEVVLASYQINQAMLDALAERGFRYVTRFWNANSNNDCCVFHHVPRSKPLDFTDFVNGRREEQGVDRSDELVWHGERGPEPRAGVVPAAPPAPPEPRIVHSSFHNVLAQPRGRSEAGHPSYAAARDAAPRARRVDRRNVYASGQVRWVEDVRD